MITVQPISTKRQFEELKSGDLVAIEWRRDNYVGDKRTRFAAYEVVENKQRTTEIILQVKNNVYFNYMMFLDPGIHGQSNCKSIVKLIQNS